MLAVFLGLLSLEWLDGNPTVIQEEPEGAPPPTHSPSSQESAVYGVVAMPLDFSLYEIRTKKWEDNGIRIQLLKSRLFETNDRVKPDTMVFIYGDVDSGLIYCVDFYGTRLDTVTGDNMKLKLLRHNYFPTPATDIFISMERQKSRCFLNLEFTIPKTSRRIKESYELNEQWQLVKGMSTFVSTPRNPR